MLRLFYEKYLPVIFWPVFLILISWGTYRIVMLPESPEPSLFGNDYANSGMENVPFRSFKPRISEVSEDGTIRWELSSEEIVGIIGGRIELDKIVVLFTFQDGSELKVLADRGTYDEAGKHLELVGNIEGEYPSVTLSFTCNSIDYFHLEKQLAMSGDVNFDAGREGVKVACPEVIADLSERLSKVDFLGGVEVDLYKMR